MGKDKKAEPREETVDEFERRFLVTAIDPEIQRAPSKRIEQGYFEGTDMRVRIVDGKTAEVTRKSGRGRIRKERNRRMDVDDARFLFDALRYKLTKRRYMKAGWEVDYFEGPLTGLVLAEFETKSPDDEVTLPPWIHAAIEVTESLSNQHLARIAYDLSGEDPDRPVRDLLPRELPRIVLTGGPCSGKSSVMAALRAEFKGVLHCIPEVATIVIEQVGAKPPFDDMLAMKSFQRTIYRVQLGFEKVSNRQAIRDGRKALLLDRGTVDGAAYMDRGVADLENVCRTTMADEYRRYHGVLCLEVPPREIYDANKANNPARSETFDQAAALGERIAKVWGGHPRFTLVRNGSSWDEKLETARAALKALLSGA
ncbi:MAG TPA: AAA family ATPase [Patescibacteria group bacterium]|nr:AAA family ATPase [Patescibacteria group bacterium]